MTKHESSSQRKGKKGGKQRADTKKLHKREQRLQESLQKAQSEQAKALAHLERAEARLQKRLARVQRMEDDLTQVRQQLGIKPEPAQALPPDTSSETPPAANTPDDASPADTPSLSAQTSVSVSATEVPPSDISTAHEPSLSSEAGQQAWEQRAVAEAVEEEVRAATERARSASSSSEPEPISDAVETVFPEEAIEHDEYVSAVIQKQEATTEPEEDTSTDEPAQAVPTQEEVQQVAAIAQEEEQVESGVARTHAEAAAIAAAEAEALAESSSARTRKARIIARQADQELTLVRAAVRNGSLTGQKAETALQAAERKSTHAHAELDDAEEAEERAISAARNAEAEAEVAEEMAFSAYDRYVRDVDARAVQAIADQEERQWRAIVEPSNEDDESTQKRPVVRPQVWRE